MRDFLETVCYLIILGVLSYSLIVDKNYRIKIVNLEVKTSRLEIEIDNLNYQLRQCKTLYIGL